MQAFSSDFNCLPTDIITVIASNSGQVWRSLVFVDHKCHDTLNNWKAYVKQFTTVGQVTQVAVGPGAISKYIIEQPERTRITLLDGVPHSEDGVETWSIEVGTSVSLQISPILGIQNSTTCVAIGGVYRRGKRVSSYPEPTMIHVIAWELPS